MEVNGYVRATAMGWALCPTCALVVRDSRRIAHECCPRCGFALARGRAGTQVTSAWLITALLLFIPANALPVMRTSGLIGAQDSTIFGGIIGFWQSGSWGIAVLIFVASVVVPLTKFAALGLLLLAVKRKVKPAPLPLSHLYRAVEFIGYWSMLDVVVVAITCALVQFKVLGAAEPRAGIAFFCAVVVCTMLAARCFDARLLWIDDRGRS
jgi:paraquat-inducible protein A